MREELKPYEAYKETELPWLDVVPSHWKLVRNKVVMELKKDRVGDQHGNHVLLSLTKQGIIARDMIGMKGKFPKEFDTYQSVNEGDLVFCLFDVDETPRTVGLSGIAGMITGAYTVFKIKWINPRYLQYYYLSLDDNKRMKPLYTGLRKVINVDTFQRTKMPFPSVDEQDQIVRYLDYQLTKINRFIKAKKKQIELLKEQKQAIINQAVTKGLDPDVKMKPSGVEWLGEVPEHWDVVRIKSCITSTANGVWGLEPSSDNSSNNIVCVRVADFDMNHLSISEKKLTYRYIDNNHMESKLLKKGDLLIEKSGGGDSQPVGRVVCFEEDYNAVCSNFIARIDINKSVAREQYLLFVLHNLQSTKKHMAHIKQTTGIQNLDDKNYFAMFISLPSLDEQAGIVDFIQRNNSHINRTIELIKTEISLITEYRTSLISSVVTGKVDVRHIDIDDDLEGPKDNLEDLSMELEDLDEAELTEEEIMDEETA